MSWWMRDKIAYLVGLGISLVVGYAIAFGIALSRSRRKTPGALSLGGFVRTHGFDISMLAFVAIPTAALMGLVYGVLLMVALDVLFGVKFDQDHRFRIVGLAAGASYIGCLVYAAFSLIKDTSQKPAGS